MNGSSNSGGASAASILLSIFLGFVALFFGFGSLGFAVIALASRAGNATVGETATIVGISVFSFVVAAACIFGIVMLNRRR